MSHAPIRIAGQHRRRVPWPLIAFALFPFTPRVFADLPVYDHIVIVVEENHSFEQVIGSPEAPYINQLVETGVHFTSMYALTHPSQPNYMHMYSGFNQGVATDAVIQMPPLTTPNFGAAMLQKGLTFGAYSQGLPETGSLVGSVGYYVRRHAPWTYWQDDSENPGPNTLPGRLHMPFDDFPTDEAGFAALPTVTYVIPDQVHNMHSASIYDADVWLDANLSDYRDWAEQNNSLLIVIWDEDNYVGDNRIPLVLSGANLRPGEVKDRYTLHSFLRTLEDMYDLPHAGLSAKSDTIYGAFVGEQPRPLTTQRFQQDLGGYDGVSDTQLWLYRPDSTYHTTTPLYVDADLFAEEGNQPSETLIRFDGLVGTQRGQVPPNAQIQSAQLIITTSTERGGANSTSSILLNPMLREWSDTDTWNSLQDGVSLDGVEAAFEYDFLTEPNVVDAPAIFMVTDTVQRWVNGEANNGWVISTEGTDDWRLYSSEAERQDFRPMLEITYWNTGLTGDFDSDGHIDVNDVDLLTRGMQGELLDGAFDLNRDQRIDLQDLTQWVHEIKRTWFGDANLDGQFTSADLVKIFQAGEYEDETPMNSTWSEGDWNGDGDFSSRDFVLAFQDGGYEQGFRTGVAVPEPMQLPWLNIGLPMAMRWWRRRSNWCG